ncbi:MAG: HlyD family efflux transporter periplasmic adaptor subunit [Aeriscardovia sp.]|nr:HlyD family efflux transporter periplasmic adaptor subunit [Aeriscardovia sp.]
MARFELHKLEDLSDSRELLEQNPKRFTSWFIYLLCLILASFIIWAWFSTKSVVVSAQGIVESNKPVQTIAPVSAGTVKSVNYTNGSHVDKGDIVVSLDTQNLLAQLDSLNEQKSSLASQISDLKSLKQSVSEGNNFANDKSAYFAQYMSYINENKADSEEGKLSSKSLSQLNAEISSYQSLISAIESGATSFNSQDTFCNSEFQKYLLQRQNLEKTLSSLETEEDTLEKDEGAANALSGKILGDYNGLASSQKSEAQEASGASSQDSEINAQNSLSQDEQKLSQANSKQAYDEQMASIQSQIASAKSSISLLPSTFTSTLASSLDQLEEQKDSLNAGPQKTALELESNKWQFLSTVENAISEDKQKLPSLNGQINLLQKEISEGELKASASGTLYIPSDIEVGMVLSAGQQIAQVISDSQSFEIKLAIPNDKIGDVKLEDGVKYSFPSFPYAQYGFLNGKITQINVTSTTDEQTGLSYYQVTGSLDKGTISNFQGQKGTIKLGMACQAKIVSQKEKMLYFILNKMGIDTSRW